ncbi:predicted protein [Streptomyces viridochromogenes DSM 40736]|uniref:Predicted protein n=1 Tax=Streptomyces viridochromogenes (strain DSM 40736 / JCM 4977 / BCRC 1201 / Tue 494) TaxID=591159 RepID=D9XB72_STRVT|nr:predicted protein [Streptomyces viridochromogenes DSM 40736]
MGWVADFPDPDTFGAALVGTGGAMNTGYRSKDVDRLIKDSRRYADRTEADQDFRQVRQSVAQDVPVLPLWQAKEYVVTTEDVGGGQYLPDDTGVFRLWSLTGI